MEIEFSQHALDQLKIRTNITRAMVRKVLNDPDNISRSFKGRRLYRKAYGQQILEVVTVKEDNKLVVITEYFVEQ
jgi:hypothetical protein